MPLHIAIDHDHILERFRLKYENNEIKFGEVNKFTSKRSLEGKRKDGTIFPIEIALIFFEDPMESSICLIAATIVDITNTKLSE